MTGAFLSALPGALAIAFLTLSPAPARAAVCPASLVPIATDTTGFSFASQTYKDVVSVAWMTMGRRSPALYATTKYGIIGAYLGSNPGAPSPAVLQMSFREGGPVGGGSLVDCWPGPSAIGVADSSSGAGRIPMGWNDGSGCGTPEQVVSINAPGGTETYGQQIDVSNGNSVSSSAVAAALSSGGKYMGYFVDSSTLYAVDVTNPAFSALATPLHATQTLPAWAAASRLVALGNGSSDEFLAGVFFVKGGGTLKFASIGSDGRLTALSATASLSSGATSGSTIQQVMAYPSGNGYFVFVVVSGGIDVFSFDGTTATRLGTIPNGANKYSRLQVPVGAPAPVIIAEKTSPLELDVIAGGYLAGQSGSPAVQTTIPALSNDTSAGFGAYIDPASPGTLYLYRIVSVNGISMQTDTFDASCVTSPPSPNPTAAFSLVNKSAQNRTDKASYVGDAFSFTDASKAGTGGAITNWYVWSNYNSSTSNKTNADIQAVSAPSLPSIVLPCLNGVVGGACSYTPANITGTSLSEKWGEEVSAGSLDSAVAVNTVTLKVPLTRVAARGSDGSVKILTGGSIDASASDGSPTGFAWAFKDAASGALATSCAGATCVPPANAASFTVAAKYAGGYQAAAVAGTIVFTDIAGSISVPATLYSSQSTTTATFALQKGSNVTITAVSYKYDNGAATSITPVPGLSSSVQIGVPALTTGVNHTVTFLVTYTGGSKGTSVSFQDTFLYSAVQYVPKAWISKQTSLTSTDTCFTNVFAGATTTCSGSAGTFYLGDQGDIGKPGFAATWDFGDGSPLDTSHMTTDFVSHTFASSSTAYTVKLTVAGTTVTQKFTVGATSPLSASISGPTSVTAGASATWSASVSGGTPIYTYSWSSSDGGIGSTGSGATFTHTFATSGSRTVNLIVHDSAGGVKNVSKSVTVGTGGGGGGGGGGTNQIVISGPASVNFGSGGTWTASVSGINSADMAITWSIKSSPAGTFSDAKSGVQLGYSGFPAPGSYTIQASGSAIINGGPITLTPSSVLNVTVAGDQHIPSAAFDVVGATFNQFVGSWSAKAGSAIQFTANETKDSPAFSWDFGDNTSDSGAAVVHSFAQAGTYTVKLTVTNSYNHAATGQSKFAIDGQTFSALIVPGAGHLASTDPPGAYATELSLFNNSNSTVTVALDFETADAGSVDPTKLPYPTSGDGFVTLLPNQGWSSSEVTDGLLGKDGLGTIFMKYSGPAPSALARIYFSAGAGAPTYGTYLPVYPISANGASALAAGSSVPSGVQNIVGLKFNDDYRGGLTIVSASPTGGVYDVKLFKDTGEQVGTTLEETIPGYQQVKLDASSFQIAAADPDHVYYAVVAPAAGSTAPAIAIGTVTDNRTRDSLLLTDDAPRPNVPAGGTASYYLAGVGRTATGAKTDVYLLNTSAYPVAMNLVFHYADGSGQHSAQISEQLPLGGGQALEIPDVVSSVFPDVAGDAIGDLRIDYQPPADAGRIVLEGRNYTDLGQGTYGMQLPPYAASEGLLPGSSARIVLTGLHNDLTEGSAGSYDYISRFGFIALGDGLVTVHAAAYDQADGTKFWTGDFSLNSAGYGHFLYIPTTGPYAPSQFAGHADFNMVITATGGDGTTAAAAFGTVQDARSRDLVFIPGKRPSS